jgi:hypothetical protein
MPDIKKYKRLRFGFRFAFLIVAYVIPLIIFIERYSLFETTEGSSTFKVGALGIVGIALLMFNFKKEIAAWINNWEFSIFKVFLTSLSKIWIFVFAYVLLKVAATQLEELTYIVGWVGASEIIAYLAIKPIADHYDHLVKREIRIKETVEAIERTKKVPVTTAG